MEIFMSEISLLISVNFNNLTTVTVNCDIIFVSLFPIISLCFLLVRCFMA